MNDFFNWLSGGSSSVTAFLIIISSFFMATLLIYMIAFIQGREISFWPPKIGERPKRKSQYREPDENATVKGANTVTAYPRHRITAYDFYEKAFSSGKEVLYLSIMSQTTLKEMEPLLNLLDTHRTKLRVLTLDPDSPGEVIEAIRSHLNENPDDPSETVRQIKRAWKQWADIAQKHTNVEVRKYKSIPTLQAIIVGDKYITIELLPYNTHPKERPGLLITQIANPELFQLFKERYWQLWKDAKDDS